MFASVAYVYQFSPQTQFNAKIYSMRYPIVYPVRLSNTGVVIGAGEACDGSGVAGDRQRQPLVQLEIGLHWCSRRSLENVCLGILLHTGLLPSAEDSSRCVTRVQAQIEF